MRVRRKDESWLEVGLEQVQLEQVSLSLSLSLLPNQRQERDLSPSLSDENTLTDPHPSLALVFRRIVRLSNSRIQLNHSMIPIHSVP